MEGRTTTGARGTGDAGAQPIEAGRLEIRPEARAALVDGRPLTLTVRELQLLTELADNPRAGDDARGALRIGYRFSPEG
jgi:DNA-binding response OmpR family regulator